MGVKHWCRRKWQWLYIKMLKEKAPAEYIARGWAIGMFFGCTIPFGFQLLLSIPVSFLLKGSKIGATLGTLITNQLTIFIIYPAQCYVGDLILGGNVGYGEIKDAMFEVLKKQDYDTLFGLGWELVAAFFVGGLLLATVMTPLTYFGVLNAVMRYRKLRAEHAARKIIAREEI